MVLNISVAVLAGIIASVLTAVVNKTWWTKERKQWISLIVSVLLGVVALIIDGIITEVPTDPVELLKWVVSTIGVVAVASQLVYAQFSEKLKVIEEVTSESEQ